MKDQKDISQNQESLSFLEKLEHATTTPQQVSSALAAQVMQKLKLKQKLQAN